MDPGNVPGAAGDVDGDPGGTALWCAAVEPKEGQQGRGGRSGRHLAVIDWTRDAAEHYADIRVDLKKKGQLIGANDLMIAAHARSLSAILVTNNVKDFRRVKGLKHENWME